jgi:protein-S-isoprenylcysteine O-methyltransferase
VRSLIQSRRWAFLIFQALIVIWVLSEARIRASRPPIAGDGQNPANVRNRMVIILGVGGGMFLGFNTEIARVGPLVDDHSRILFFIGVGVAALGIILRAWAVQALGRFFQLVLVVQREHKVVNSGPYRILRHPSYSGALLTCIGIGLTVGRWVSLGFMVVLPLAAFVHRIVFEERMLVDGLGDDYVAYRKGTWRLVPLVW